MGSAHPVVPPLAGLPEELTVPGDRELAGVVAHGLLNTLAVLSSAAGALRRHNVVLAPSAADDLVNTIVAQSKLIGDGLTIVLPYASHPFRVAAAGIVASVARVAAPCGASEELLEDLIADCVTVGRGLGSLVRGLPEEVVELLDGLLS